MIIRKTFFHPARSYRGETYSLTNLVRRAPSPVGPRCPSALTSPSGTTATTFANQSLSVPSQRLSASAVNPIFTFTNELSLTNDGWAQLAPFGDYPGQALITQPDGTTTKSPALQRLDRPAAQQMVAKFKSPWHRLKRYFTGCPIYIGHPDVPAFANDSADRSAKGIIIDLEVRDTGLYCKPIFTAEGSHLIETQQYRAFSAYWTAKEIEFQNSSSRQPLKIYQPEILKSAGLTNHPNLPVELLNENPAATIPTTNSNPSNPSPIVNKQIILDFLASHGITLANQAPDAQVSAALEQLGHRVIASETTLASRAVELATLQTELANERQFHADTLLDRAVTAGTITLAQRLDWSQRLGADFANTATALAALPSILKTHSLTLNLGARKAEIANATDRRETLDTLIKTEMSANGLDYDHAFAAVQKNNPALFSAMKQPLNPS